MMSLARLSKQARLEMSQARGASHRNFISSGKFGTLGKSGNIFGATSKRVNVSAMVAGKDGKRRLSIGKESSQSNFVVFKSTLAGRDWGLTRKSSFVVEALKILENATKGREMEHQQNLAKITKAQSRSALKKQR